jgi:protein-L-isoaspartate(D-aspartate) O-methyltransferase
MSEAMALTGREKVLEIGTGSGYQAAVLAELAKEVYTVERIAVLAKRAEGRYRELGYTHIHVKVADGTLGWPDASPFDRIIITAGTPKVPHPVLQQLADQGILIAPVGDRFSQQIIKVRTIGEKVVEEYHTPCVFVPLIGEYGWKKEGS